MVRQAPLRNLLAGFLFVASACVSDADPPSPPAPAPLEAEEPAQADPIGENERSEATNELQARQLAIAADLRAAVDASDADAAGSALAELGRSLSELRGSQLDGTLVDAVRWFSSAEAVELRAAVDGRRVVPALELLLDVRDGAAIDRLNDSYGEGAAAERFRAALSLSLSWSNAAATIHSPGGDCDFVLDGDAVDQSPSAVIFGSHTVSCGAGPTSLVLADSLVHEMHLVAGELRLATP